MRRLGRTLALLATAAASAPAGDLPPLALSPRPYPALFPEGHVVSRPLEPTAEPPPPLAPTATEVLVATTCRSYGSAARTWGLAEAIIGGTDRGDGTFTGARFRVGGAIGRKGGAGLEATYRFLHDPLHLQSGDVLGVVPVPCATPFALLAGYRTLGLCRADRDAESHFHGGVIGVRSGWGSGRLQCQWQCQVALGAGRNATFAAIPEVELRLGYEMWDGARAYLGLDALGTRGPALGDFTAGGLLLGLDVRY